VNFVSKNKLAYFLIILLTGCINQSQFTSLDPDQSVLSTSTTPTKATQTYVETNPDFYLVKPGDTLYSIAFRFGLDYRKLAIANNINASFNIYEGQSLALKEASESAKTINSTTVSSAKPALENTAKPVTKVNSQENGAPVPVNKQLLPEEKSWLWPHNGKIVRTFVSDSSTQKGIDIRGVIGDSVMAAATGVVVYAGNGLPGYGNLIIVEHEGSLLSAYAFAEKILVNESDSVLAGQQIATMGKQGDQPSLHFEIRRNGKPVNPQSYLPKR
jgi:lipoprotein NlpD